MTDQEIRCAILKYVYDAKKTGKVAMAVLSRITSDYSVDKKRVLSILRSLKKEGLLKSVTRGYGYLLLIMRKNRDSAYYY